MCKSLPAFFVPVGPMYLHSAAQTEDAVVCVLRLKALEGGLHNVVLFGEQVIGPVKHSALAHRPPRLPCIAHVFFLRQFLSNAPPPGAAYLSPSCLYPAALQYQLASGFIQRCSHGRLLMNGASDGADMFAGIRRGDAGVEGVGCRQLQNVKVVRSSFWSGERTERPLGECGRPSLDPLKRLNQPSRTAASLSVPARTPTFTRPLTSALQASCLPATTPNLTAVRPPTASRTTQIQSAPACQWSRTIPSHCVTRVLRGSAH